MFIVACSIPMAAQVLYSEDFENGWPEGYVLHNVDMLTPNDPDLVGLADSAWSIRYITQEGWNSNTAFSVSWYLNDEGPSDDWMVLPAVDLLDNTVISWDAQAITSSGDFRDRYQVAISTAGTEIEDFEENPLLFDTGNEGEIDLPQARTVNLADAGYANQTVYIAFRNFTAPYDPSQPQGPGNGGNELMIDNILIENLPTSVKVVEPAAIDMNLSPNPATQEAFVQFTLQESSEIQVIATNSLGQEIYSKELGQLGAGEQSHLVETGQWANGTYFLRIQSADWMATRTFIVQK